jgi:hypothetical protein
MVGFQKRTDVVKFKRVRFSVVGNPEFESALLENVWKRTTKKK